MPNWCSNTVILRGSNQRDVQRLADAFDAGELCQAVIPVPEILRDTTAPTQPDDAAAAAQRRAQTGYDNWYDFCVNRWGTKWDVGGADCGITLDDDGLGFTASFESAWAPPIGVYEQLIEDGYSVRGFYFESGMGFAGIYDDGVDETYSDWGDAQGARDMLPQELDEMFGISESQAEYEEEEHMEEELYRFTKEGAEKLGLDQK